MVNTNATSPLRLRVSDGASIAYRVHPAGSEAPVVALVHSLALDHHFWDRVAERLAGKATVVALDARGHGRSEGARVPYTAQRIAQDLVEILDELKVARAIVGGASMGGCIALQFAGTYPSRTRALALIDTTAWYGASAPKEWEERIMKAIAQGLPSLVPFQQTRWFSDGFRAREPQVVRACVHTFVAIDIEAYTAACRMLGSFDGRALLATIHVPTQVLVGEEDYATPVAMAEALHAGIVGSRLQIIKGARHLTPLERPDVVAASLLELCADSRP